MSVGVLLKKPIAIAVVLVSALIIIGTCLVVWVLLAQRANAPDIIIEYTDLTASKQVDVTISNLSFSPPNIKIRKGTTVTWTNQDSIGHNVVADDSAHTGGLPIESPVFGRGGAFSQTFKQTGTFYYRCAPHTFMKGIVEVVE